MRPSPWMRATSRRSSRSATATRWRFGFAEQVADYEDPGWRPLFKELKVYVIPFAGPILFKRKQRPAVDPLTAFRLILLGLVGSVLVWGWILLYIVQSDRWWKSDQSRW